jgi:hypothetical protein
LKSNKGHSFFGWPFLLVDLVLDLRRNGFTKIAGGNFERAPSARPVGRRPWTV